MAVTYRLLCGVSLCTLLAGTPDFAFAERTVFPYCVSGADWAANGHLVKLGMPAEALGYQWSGLRETTNVLMVRPAPPSSGTGAYLKETDAIHNEADFIAFVQAHPGRDWLIGNEPNVLSQDGMFKDEYTRMYRKYYTTIKGLDPTARIATCGIYSAVHPSGADGFAHMTAWYNDVLDYYEQWYGETMPVDIWNFHFYVPSYVRDTQFVIDEMIDPFTNWVKTIRGGAYADAEIWCTEFGIGFWMGYINAELVAPWMQRLCLQLEQSDVDRWFWFVAYAPPLDPWGATSLLLPGGTKSVLGEVYTDLAHGYPNTEATPMPDPVPSDQPPAVFADDFDDGDTSNWMARSGPWSAADGGYRCDHDTASDFPWWGSAAMPPYWYRDCTIEARVRINGSVATSYWAGISANFPSYFSVNQRWLVFMRQDGSIGLHSQATGTITELPGVVEDTSVFHHLRLDIGGLPTVMHVYVDGRLLMQHVDLGMLQPEGLAALEGSKSNCTFDDVRVHRVPLMEPAVLNGGFEEGAAQEIAPWIKWRGPRSSNEVEWHRLPVGLDGSMALRVTSPALPKVYDAGVKRAIPGAKPGTEYAIAAQIKCDRQLGGRQNMWLGIDPTGQIDDPDAPTIQWSWAPASVLSYHRIQTPYVVSTSGRLGVWFRAQNLDQIFMAADIDGIELLQRPAGERAHYLALY